MMLRGLQTSAARLPVVAASSSSSIAPFRSLVTTSVAVRAAQAARPALDLDLDGDVSNNTYRSLVALADAVSSASSTATPSSATPSGHDTIHHGEVPPPPPPSGTEAGGGGPQPDPVATPDFDLTPPRSDASAQLNMVSLKPREVVSELDTYIIGQQDAKKAISVALRNRWRRLRLPEEIQAEIMPKNILMVGPTGVGKTEIARRLAKLAKAPFVKVEATKFTEVGFHGRDVDTIIRDLLEASLQLTRQLKTEQFRDEIRPLVEARILAAMTGPEARADTVESFRRLLHAGELDNREVQIEVPVKLGVPPEFEMSVQGASIDIGEFMTRLGGAKHKPRMEKKRLLVHECWPILEEHELEKKLSTLDIRKEAVDLAEQNGIVFIDEIDKIVSDKRRFSGDASSEGVQRDLLPLIEGCTVDVKRFGPVKTDYMLFVASGAFHEAKPADMLAELQGRLPIRVELKGLDAPDLRRILVEPKANLIQQQTALIGAEDVNIEFTDAAITKIAELAAQINRTVENIGARRLHTVLEKIMEDVSFEAPDMNEGELVVIDEDIVVEKVGDMLKRQDLSKFIL